MSRIGFILWIMAAACLGSLGITLLLLSMWVPFLWIPVILGTLFISGAIAIDRRLYVDFFMMRTTRKGLNMGTLILLVMALLVIINFLAIRNPKVWDVSQNKVHSLSPQSIQLIQQLKSDVYVKFFYEKGTAESEAGRKQFTTLIHRYQDYSDRIKLEFVEVNENPEQAQKYGVREGRGVVFVDYEGRHARVDKVDEQEVTSALIKVLRTEQKKVYFLTGHSELAVDNGSNPRGAFMAKQFLEGSRYLVENLNLTQTSEVPADAAAVLAMAPEQAFLEMEIAQLREYLKKGGHLLLAINPGSQSGLNALLKDVGLELKNNYVVTTVKTAMGEAINPQVTMVNIFSTTSPITKLFTSTEMVLFRLPSAIVKTTPQIPGFTYEDVIGTGQNSVAFADKSFKGEKEKGPFVVGVSVKGKMPGAAEGSKDLNMVVFGSGDFLGNQLILQNLNRDLFLNTVAYLAENEELISITPREADVTSMNMTTMQSYVFFFGFLIPLPLIFFVISLVIWLRRRHA